MKLIVALIAGIATCNYISNTSSQLLIIQNPKPGSYFVFSDYPEKNKETIMKVKEIKDSAIVFYKPTAEIIGGFEFSKSESVVKEADKKGPMFGQATVTISKIDISEMAGNNSLTGAINAKPRIEYAF